MGDVTVTQEDRDLFISLRGFGKDSDLAASVNQGWYRAEQVEEIATHRTEATRALTADVEGLREALKLIGDMLPLIEPARLREEAAAMDGTAQRMPVRQIVRRATALLAATGNGGEGRS